jgi:hypothetical protein
MNNTMKMLSLAAITLLLLATGCNKGTDAKSAANVTQAPPPGGTIEAGGAKGADAEAICADCGKPGSECTCEGHDHSAHSGGAKGADAEAICADCGKPGSECTCEGHDHSAHSEGEKGAGEAAVCASCAKPESECTCEGHDHGAKTDGAAKQMSKTADGIRIVDATAVDVNPKPYVGRVAINGKVGDVWAEKGTFTLIDLKQMPGCTDGCCPMTNIPVSVPQTEFSGTFPKAGDVVLVVCDLSTTPTGGYAVKVEEVRQGDKTIIQPSKAA